MQISKSLRPSELKSVNFSFLSDELVTLLSYVRDDMIDSQVIAESDDLILEDIDIYLTNLVFSHVVKRLKALSMKNLK